MTTKKIFLTTLALLLAVCYARGENQRTIYDSTYVYMESSGLSHVYGHKLVEMKTAKGCSDNSVIKLDYDPLSTYVEFQFVVIHRFSGRLDTLVGGRNDVKIYDYTAPARLIYWGAKQKMVEVGHLDVGDKLEYRTYRKGFTYALLAGNDDKYIPPMRGHFYDIVPFWSSEPVDLKVYRLNALTAKNMRYQVYNGKVKTETVKYGKRTIYTFSKRDIKPLKAEQGMLAHNDVECKLLLSTSPDWQAKSVWFYNVNEDYGSFNATKELVRHVDLLLVGAKDELDSISRLTHWVADNMRYAGISMGPGEGYTLHNAQMNFTDRCGVCKDKAGLLVAMLRAAGFKAYAAMTMAGERIDRIPADQFNHSVCVVQRRNGDYQLLDPTWVPNVRELWSSAEQQQGYLMGLPDGADLMETPLSPPENHHLTINAETAIDKNGTLTGTITVSAEGQSDAAVRRVFSRQADWLDALEIELLKVCPQAQVRIASHTRPEDYLRLPVKIVYQVEIADYAVVTKDQAVFVPIALRNIFSRAMTHLRFDTSAKERKLPFADACSRLVRMSESLSLPFEYKSCRYALPQSLDDATGAYSLEYNLHGKAFDIIETVKLNKRKYEASDWPTFRQIVENQNQAAATPVVLVK
ncbi:MAG: DUF3857 and transglutaminase domain-containing protein [Bacteroidales bacterium]|nr:DUF3857 and transglutaminase domain-containing protein [Bacteroidales bacterium]